MTQPRNPGPPTANGSSPLAGPLRLWRYRSMVAGLLLTFAGWCGVAWWALDQVIQQREEKALAEHRHTLSQTTDHIADGLRRGLSMLHGIPAAVAQHPQLHTVLQRFLDAPRSPLPYEENRHRWSNDPELPGAGSTGGNSSSMPEFCGRATPVWPRCFARAPSASPWSGGRTTR